MDGKTKLTFSMIVIALMTLTSFAVLVFWTSPEEETNVTAAKSNPSSTSGGYFWVDNNDPDPKVEFDWIECHGNPKSYYFANVWSYYQSYVYDSYQLPFSFPFFGSSYTTCSVVATGYIDFGGWQYSSTPGYYYFYYDFPSTNYENGVISAWGYAIGGYYYYNTPGPFKVYALNGETYGEKWVCFEWYNALAPGSYVQQPSPEQYGVTFEIIIYESGLIKIQYLDATSAYSGYSNGAYGVVGIEDVTGTKGVTYKAYSSATLKDGLAVMFGKNFGYIDEVNVETEDNKALYAQHKDYTIQMKIRHPISNEMFKVAVLQFGDGIADAIMMMNADGTYYISELDPMGAIDVNFKACRKYDEGTRVVVEFRFAPTFSYPSRNFQDLKVVALGAGILPTSVLIPDSYWVENQLDVYGALSAVSETRGFVQSGGWVHGGEVFHFTGLKVVYPMTSLSPMTGTYSISATDERGIVWIQEDVDVLCNVRVVAENDFVLKSFNITITGVPPGCDISEQPPYLLGIDPFVPSPPSDLKIHSDSFDDPNVLFDNDNEVYVTWAPSQDFESGIAGYYVTTVDPAESTGSEKLVYVAHPGSSAQLILEGLGTRKVFVYAVDKAGNPSLAAFAVTKVDQTQVTFSEFSPGDSVWIRTAIPICSILVTDTDGSGVSAKDVEYSISTGTVNDYGPWFRVTGIRDGPLVRASVKATFIDGKTNYIRYRARDVAGNGWTYSGDFNVWVDVTEPTFQGFQPYEEDYQSTDKVVVSVDVTDIHGTRPGSGVVASSLEYRVSTAGVQLFGDWMPVNIVQATRDTVKVSMEITFKEGDQNYIQFRGYDEVQNFVTSKAYNVKVNSAPVVGYSLSTPVNGEGMPYTTAEQVLFDASKTIDYDGDTLEFEWYSDITGFLSSADSFTANLVKGDHKITLIVNDAAHSEVVPIEVSVIEAEQIDQESIDTDKDGIYDAWEKAYGLDPLRKDSDLDSDFDTFTNLQEYQSRTDPTNRNSHPPYPYIDVKDEVSKDAERQFKLLTLTIALVSVLIVISLIALALSKRGNFLTDVDEEREMEKEEMQYRSSIKRKGV